MEAQYNTNKGLIFVISGPSGSGKTTLREQLLRNKELKDKLVKLVSFTTRPRRPAEQDKKDYFFITKTGFQQRLRAKKILEWTKYLGYYYATSKDFIEEQLKKGKYIVLCLDLKGAARIKQLYPKCTVTIFILPPSLEALRKRIEGRSRETKKDEIHKRLHLAKRELAASRQYDYCIVNQNLSQAVREIENIILEKYNL